VQLPPIAATTVGSFPRPSWLAAPGRDIVTLLLEGDVLREAQDDATRLVLLEQERLGLDLVTDGEQRRTNFISHALGGMDGFDVVNQRPKEIRRRPGNVQPVPRVVGPVRRRAATTVADTRFAVAHTGLPVKMAIPGPVTVVDSTYDEFYGDEAALAMDVAAAVNAELLEMQAAGCAVLQIDEPAMTRWHEKTAAYGARALDRCLDGVTVPTLVHLCYGYPGGGTRQHEYEYPELIEILMATRIGGFSLEFARSGYDPALLRACGDRLVMFGCIDPSDVPTEPLEVVIGRIRAALRYVEPERLLVAPDCGLMTISRALAHEKAARLVEAAREARRTL